MQCGRKVTAKKKNTQFTWNWKGNNVFSKYLNWSLKSAVYLLLLKAKRLTLVSMWFISSDLCKLFRSATSFFTHVVNL